MENTRIHHFAETDEWLVIENDKILKVCSSKEDAEYFFPFFSEGDYVDAPEYGIKNAKVLRVDRYIEGDVFYQIELLNNEPSDCFEPNELIASVNPPQD